MENSAMLTLWNIDKESTAGHISIPLSHALHTLPPDVLLTICMYLDAGSLVCFAYVCKYFYNLAQRSSLSLNLDKLLSVFVSSVSGFKRQLLLSGLAVYGWDISGSSCIGEQPRCQVFCRTLGDGYDIAAYLFKFEEYSSEFSTTWTTNFGNGRLFGIVRAAFQSGISFELERDDGVMVIIDWSDKSVGSQGSGLLHWQYSCGSEQVWRTGFPDGLSKSWLLYKRNITWEDGKAVVRRDLVDILLCGSSLGRFLWLRFSADRWSDCDWWKDNEDIIREGKEYFNNKRKYIH